MKLPPEKRTLRHIFRELVAHPFLPMLFIAEAIKEVTVVSTDIEPAVAYAILAVVMTFIWILSDVPREELIGETNDSD